MCSVIFNSLFLILLPITFAETSFRNVYPKVKTVHLDHEANTGEPLFLTPLIEAGNISLAQNLSQVVLSDPNVNSIKSYAGYLTVNKEYNSNLFFWFFPALVDFENAPVILWLQGGPGASSMFGLLVENGPIRVTKNMNLEFNKYTWNANHSVIYIDNPVGAGFSFTDSENGYATNETMVGENLYHALLQFFQLFPKLQKNPFFATGESYGSKYVPAIGFAIHTNNPKSEQKINLQGLIMGDGLSDPGNQLSYGDYLYQIGLIDLNTRESFRQAEAQVRDLIAKEDWENAADQLDMIIGPMFWQATKFGLMYNYLYSKDYTTDYWQQYVQLEHVRKLIHVGNQTFNDGGKAGDYLSLDIVHSVVPWISELLNHYRVLFYNGQLDIIVAYPLTENFLQLMDFSAANEYKNATRVALYNNDTLVGYLKKAGNLSEVLVRNAGHLVPLDQPESAYYLISKFVANLL